METKSNLQFLWSFVSYAIATVVFLVGIGQAHAANLNFVTSESISLSSPATTLTIATSSMADVLQVNATSVIVTLSSSTAGTFTLISPSYDLSIATSSSGGAVAIVCSGGIETATLSQTTGSTVYTVTPTTSNCANASAPVITIPPSATNVTTNGTTISWATNIAADSTVRYGTSTAYGASSTDSTLVTTHSISLTSLNVSTLYHYEVISAEYGTSTTSGDYTFTTAALTPSTPSVPVAAGGGGSAYTLSINSDTTSITSPNVTLSLYGTGAYTMELSNTSSFTNATWIPYVTSTPWTLASTIGEQTVFVQYRSVSGSMVGSAHASINLATPSVPVTTTISTTSTSGMSIAQMQSLLVSLEAQLQALEVQAGNQSSPTTTSFVFSRNLQRGMTGIDVKALQEYLIQKDKGAAAQTLAHHGTTKNFAMLTYAALVEFQKSVGITPASGFFGPITRGWVNGHE